MVVPIHALRAGAARLGSGDLGQRIAIKTGDEVEALANQFNDMAGRLQESYANLERKVEERTQELHQRTDELGRSVGELRALGEVSQAVNSTLDLETVLSTIVAKAVQLSDTDAGAIYVFDEVQREFHLRATYGMDQELIDALTQQHIGLDEPNVELAARAARADPGRRFARGSLLGCQRDHPARRFPRAVGGAALARVRTSSACWWCAAARLAPFRRTPST